jgi:signal transduction histidine kinase
LSCEVSAGGSHCKFSLCLFQPEQGNETQSRRPCPLALIRFRYALTILSALILWSTALQAQIQPISRMVHMSWSGHEGAPQGIIAMAQTPDGILWIAGVGGLHTFDGVSFAPFRLPEATGRFFSQTFHFLFVSRNGDLWAFGYHGAPGQIHNGTLRIYDRADGASIDNLTYPQQGPDDRIWAVLNERQLVRLDADGIWRKMPTPGGGHSHVTMLFIDPDGTTWVVADSRLYRQPSHARTLEPTSVYVYGPCSLRRGFHHDLWISSSGPATARRPARHLQHLDNNGDPIPVSDIREGLNEALPEADGSLWALTTGNILLHLREEDLQTQRLLKAAQYPDRTTLDASAEADWSHAVVRGSDGSLWIGGMGGLEQFTRASLVQAIPGAMIGTWSNCIDAAGTLWISSPNKLLYRLGNTPSLQLFARDALDLYCSADGTVLFQESHGLSVLRGDRIVHLPAIPGLHGFLNDYIITGAAQIEKGTILAAVAGGAIGRSLWMFQDGRWQQFLSGQEMPEVAAIYGDGSGRILLGFRGSDTIGAIEGGALRRVMTGQPGLGNAMGFTNTTYGLFAYGLNGIALEGKADFHTLSFARPENAASTTGLVEARDGDLWINSAAGIVRIESSEIRQAIADPRHEIISNDIQEGDIVGPAFPRLFSCAAHRDSGGRLWFSTLNGIVSVDASSVKAPPPPLLSIRSIRGDSSGISQKGTFPPNIGILAIDYVGVDYRNPMHVSYRYRLDGYDNAWQDAGSRTEAIYTHLRPGQYRFEVVARNSYGVWTAPVVSAWFRVLPRFYQQIPFQIFCGIVLAMLMWLAIRARLRSEAAVIRERAEERANERISIARDLHDTLLQGVQGLLLTFHAAAERVPENHESKRVLERALSTADRIILEGRDRVKGLRGQDLSGDEFCVALRTLGDDLNTSGAIRYSVSCQESRYTLTPHIASEVFLIAREAVLNAFRHAQASTVTVRIHYGSRDFSLECYDDGKGFDPESPYKQSGPGHWGLRGMAERAERLRAKFKIRSHPGRGTSVMLTLRAQRAYES